MRRDRIVPSTLGITAFSPIYENANGLSAEFDSSGTTTASYGYWPDGEWTTDPLFLKTSAGTFYYQNDHLGTPHKLISNTGAVVWAAYYKAFGEVLLEPGNSVTNNLRFAGQYFDAETSLHYNYRRYYDPAIGRYLSEDPLGLDGGLNRYAYVDADPVHNVDPTGECLLAGAVGGAAVGAIVSIIEQAVSKGCIDWGDVGSMALMGGVTGAVTCGVGKFLRYPPCGRNSFSGDTLVHTETGLKPIEQIGKGDQVLSLAEWNNEKSYQTVVDVIRNEKDYDLYTITLANGEAITATDGHPLFVPNQGWTDARLLKQGDRLYLQSQGTVRIQSITTEHQHETVYNLEVANNHTFFVGVVGVLVHNMRCDQIIKDGGYERAKKIFDRLTRERRQDVKIHPNGTISGKTSNGTNISIRPSSKTGPPTLQVSPSNGGTQTKYRF